MVLATSLGSGASLANPVLAANPEVSARRSVGSYEASLATLSTPQSR